MALVNLGVKALINWVNSIISPNREIHVEDLQDGEFLLRVVYKIKNEPDPPSTETIEERFELIAQFVEEDCRFSPTKGTSLSWENIRNGINLTVEISKLLLLLVYHDMMNERCTLKTLECEVEREIANLTGSFVMESFGCVYLKSGLDTYLAKRYLHVSHELLERTASTSTSNASTVSSLSDEDSPMFHRTPKVTFLDVHTVASSSVSKSPIQDIMNTPKFQLRKLQRQIVQDRDYRDGLERELASKISLISIRESHINQLEYNLNKMKGEQSEQEQSTRAQIDELESKINSLQLRLNEILKEYKDFKSNASLAEQKVDQLEEEKGVLSSQVRAAYAQLSTSQTEVSRLKETLASCQEEWQTKIDYLISELNQATSQKDVLTEQIEILQGKISRLEDDLTAAKKNDVGENMGPIIERDELESEIVQLKKELDSTLCCLKKAEANEEEKSRQLSSYEQEITQQNELLEQQNLLIEDLVRSKDHIMKELQKEISEQREALQKKIDHLQLQLDKAEQQKADQISELLAAQKALEERVNLLILEKERLVQAAERENLASLDREEVLKKELELLKQEEAKFLMEKEKYEESERLKKELQEQLLAKTEAVEDYKDKREKLEHEIFRLKTELDSTVDCLKKAEASDEAKTWQLSAIQQEIKQHKKLLEEQNLEIEDMVRSKDHIIQGLQMDISEQKEALQEKIDKFVQAEQQKADQISVLQTEQKALEKQVDLLVLEKETLFQTKQQTEREKFASLEREELLKKEVELLKMEETKLLKEKEKYEESEGLKRKLQDQLMEKTEAVEDYKAKRDELELELVRLKNELEGTVACLKKAEANEEEKSRQLSAYEQEITEKKKLLEQQNLKIEDLVRSKDHTMKELQKEILDQGAALQKRIHQLEQAEQQKDDKISELRVEQKALEEKVDMLVLEKERLVQTKQSIEIEMFASHDREEVLKKELESLKLEQATLLKVKEKCEESERLKKVLQEQGGALQKRIHQLEQAEQQKDDKITQLQLEQKTLEEKVDILVLEKERLVQTKQSNESEKLASHHREEVLKKELESLKLEQATLMKVKEKCEASERLEKELQEQLLAKTEAVEENKAKREELEHKIVSLKNELDSTVGCLEKAKLNEEAKTCQVLAIQQEIIQHKKLLEKQNLHIDDIVRDKDHLIKELQMEIFEQKAALQEKIDKLEQAEQQKADQISVLQAEQKALEKHVDMLALENERLVQAAERENLASLDREVLIKKELESLKLENTTLLKEKEINEESEKLRKELQEQLFAKTEAVKDHKAKSGELELQIVLLKNELDSTAGRLMKAEANEEAKTQQLSSYEEEITQQKKLLEKQNLSIEDLVGSKDHIVKELQKEISEQRVDLQKKIDQLEQAEQQKTDQISKLLAEQTALEKQVNLLVLEKEKLFETKQTMERENLTSLEREEYLQKELESFKQEKAMHVKEKEKNESERLKKDLLEQLSAKTEAVEDYKAERDELEGEIVRLKNELDNTVGCLKKAEANEEATKLKLTSCEDEITHQKKLLEEKNVHIGDIVQSKDHIIQGLQMEISEQREALQEKIDHLKRLFEQAEQQKDGHISVLQAEQKVLEKQVDVLVLEKDRLLQTKQAAERENTASRKMEEVLKKELELLKMEKATLLKEREKYESSERLKLELQEQLLAKTEAVQHYKAQVEKAVNHYNDKKQLLHDSQEEVTKLKHSLEIREKEVKAAGMENKLLQMELEKAQSKEKNMLGTLARLEAQVAFADLNLRAQNRILGHDGSAPQLCHLEVPDIDIKVEPKRSMSSDSLDRSSLEDSLNNTRKLLAPDESSTPLVRSSERLAAKRSALKAESLETLYFTPINTRHRTNAENKTEMDFAFVNPSSSVKRRRTTQVINITMTKKTPGGVEDDETFYSLASARSQPNLSSANSARPISMELFDTPAKMAAAGSDQLSGLPGYRRSTLHSQTASTFCVGAENEPDGASDDWMRIAELQARNKACLPHLKSSYPVEFEVGRSSTFLFTDEEVRTGDPTETIRRASLMPGQLQRSVTAHRHSLAAPQSTVGARSHRLSLMADHWPSKLVGASQLRSPGCKKRSALTSVTQTSPEKKMKPSCFPRPLTPKNKNTNSGPSSSQLHAALSPADRRQSMMFTIDTTPKSNRNSYLKKGLNKLRSSTRKSPGKTSKRSPAKSAHKENMPAGASVTALGPGGKRRSFKSPRVKDNKSPKIGGKKAKSPQLTASARKVKT
nr:nuclear mitotic apparatus protein 1-like [Nerophis lumbriciformis]